MKNAISEINYTPKVTNSRYMKQTTESVNLKIREKKEF